MAMREAKTKSERGIPASPSPSAQAPTGTSVCTTMATITVMTKKAVPQRTWMRENLAAFSGVRDRPCSKLGAVVSVKTRHVGNKADAADVGDEHNDAQ